MVEKIFTGLAEKRKDEEPRQSQMFLISELAEADGHGFMAPRRLVPICAQKAIPPGEIKTKIAVMFLDHHRMMYPVHLWRDYQESQNPIDSTRQSDIAMVEHAGGIQEHLKQDDSYGRNPQNHNSRHLNPHGQKDFNRMKSNPGGDIKIEVCMVNPVEAPESRDGMKHGVLEVDN